MSDNETPIEKAVELLVYAPIGLAMFAKDTVPTFMKMFVARGHTEVTQRRKSANTQAGNYKTIGQMAESLSLSIKTISTFRSRIMEKMKLVSNSDLTYYALKNGLIQ